MVNFVKKRRIFQGFTTVNGFRHLEDIELIKQDLINHFYTKKKERVMNPEFGSIIWDKLFETFTEFTVDEIILDSKRIIATEPRVALNSIIVDQFEHGLVLQIDLTYIPFNFSEMLSLQFDKRLAEEI